ncbi:MAG: ATP-dependent zinc metalloprotease FtsH [bacterium]
MNGFICGTTSNLLLLQSMKKTTKNIYKNFILVILILFSFALFASLAYQESQPNNIIDLSTLAQKIMAGEVKELNVQGSTLEIGLQDGKTLMSQKEESVDITQTLLNLGVSPEKLGIIKLEIQGESSLRYWMSILIPTLLPLIIIGFIFWLLMGQAKGGMNQAFTFGRANLRLFSNFKDKVMFTDVAGLEEPKQELAEIVDFLKTPQKYLDIGAKIPRGVLLMGPPGAGKTLLARAVAGEAGVPFFHISASEFVEMFVGVGASRIRDMFATAKQAAPAILFIDEIDAVGRERGTGMGGGHDEREQTLNQILVEMDGFDTQTRVIVLAATNRPDVLDQALLRPGRFDRRIVIDLPDINERESILKIHSRNKPLKENINFRKIATRTPGFSGADLANLINEAAILAVKEKNKKIGQDHVYESIEKVLLGPARKSRIVSDRERKITAYHEAGHAIVAANLKDSDPVHKISIISRGQAGGYTLKLPLKEQRLKTKSQFMADLAVFLGGYVSEKLTFGEVTTGASNDLKHVSAIAQAIVTKYGMSDKIGPMALGKSDEMVFLGREISTTKNYSESVAMQIDEEIKAFVTHAYKTASKILSNQKDNLKKVSDALIEKEVLEQEEFYTLIDKGSLKQVKA